MSERQQFRRLMRWQSHQGENICDGSMVSPVARWPKFDLRICSWTANPIYIMWVPWPRLL